MQWEASEEVEKVVDKDIKFSLWFNAERMPMIKKAAEKVANLKFKAGEQKG